MLRFRSMASGFFLLCLYGRHLLMCAALPSTLEQPPAILRIFRSFIAHCCIASNLHNAEFGNINIFLAFILN
jgi:hypothetical protein